MSENRRKLIEAAYDEFLEVGFSEASLESIAARAGTELEVVRALFIDIDSLLKVLLKEVTDPIVSTIALVTDNADDPRTMISECLRLMDQWLLVNPKYIQLIRSCMAEGSAAMRDIYRQSLYPSDFYERLSGFVKSGKILGGDILMVMVLLDSLMFFPHLVMPAIKEMIGDESEKDFHSRRREAIMNLLDRGMFAD
ncbi:MAG: TetR/AcrR family transcriptional regulator [FCB group bacterium]|nr:TetR/AcrR family transcriptional regulator [FCB group bacterium]